MNLQPSCEIIVVVVSSWLVATDVDSDVCIYAPLFLRIVKEQINYNSVLTADNKTLNSKKGYKSKRDVLIPFGTNFTEMLEDLEMLT